MIVFGQEKLCNKIDELTLSTFPHTLMLIGKKGSGKRKLVEYIAQKYNLRIVDYNDISFDSLVDIQLSTIPSIYILSDLTIKEQNQLLKFFEEPCLNAFIILISESKDEYLNTILKRCQIWYLDSYTKEQIRKLCIDKNIDVDDSILDIIETPGDVDAISGSKINSLLDLANKVLNKINQASYGNLFNISQKFESEDYDIDLFVKLLHQLSYQNCLKSDDVLSVEIYNLTNTLYKNIRINHINKLQLLENYIFQLRRIYET